MRDRGLEPLHLLDLLGRHASSGGAHVLSRHHGPMRVLEAHIIKIRLLGAEGALELTCVGGALHHGVEGEGRRTVPICFSRRTQLPRFSMEYSSKVSLSFASAMNLSACALRDASTQLAATTSQDDWGSHALRRTPREDCAAKYPQPQGHILLFSEITLFSCPGYRRANPPVVSKINQWIGKRTKARCNGETRTINLL